MRPCVRGSRRQSTRLDAVVEQKLLLNARIGKSDEDFRDLDIRLRMLAGHGADVQGKCPPKCSARMSLSIPRWYQMAALPELPETAAPAGFQHRCISSRCLCGCPTPLPSLESTGPQAWPAALPSSAPSAEMSVRGVAVTYNSATSTSSMASPRHFCWPVSQDLFPERRQPQWYVLPPLLTTGGGDSRSILHNHQSKVGEVVGVQFLDLVGHFGDYADTVLDHQFSQFRPVD